MGLNQTEVKIFEYLERDFWTSSTKNDFSTAQQVVELVVDNFRDISKEIFDFIDQCLLLSSSRPSTEKQYLQSLGKLKEKMNKGVQNHPEEKSHFSQACEKNAQEMRNKRKDQELNEKRKTITNKAMELETEGESSSITGSELNFISYLEKDLFDDIKDYRDAEDLISRKFSFNIEAVHPEIQNFMNNLLQKEKITISREEYNSEINALLLRNKKILTLSPTMQEYPKFDTPQNPKLLSHQPQEKAFQTTNVCQEILTNKSNLTQFNGSQRNHQIEDYSRDIQCRVEYREIEIDDKIKSLLNDFIDSFTGVEIKLPNEEMEKYSLVNKIHDEDKSGVWTYDHLQGCIDISFIMKSGGPLPKRIKLEKNFFKNNPIDYKNSFQGSKRKGLKMPLKEFLLEVAGESKKNHDWVPVWIDELHKNHVDKLEEIVAWNEKDWEHAKIGVNGKKMIRDYLNTYRSQFVESDNRMEEEKKTLSEAEKYAVTHRIKRFLIWKTRPNELINVGYLDKRAIELGFKEIKKKFHGDYLLKQLKSFYKSFANEQSYSKDLKFPSGLLLYGPPGTGKTLLTQILPTLIGLTPISIPIGASDVNRGLVGETERLLRELLARAKKIPYLQCYLAIDEIDGLGPKRNEKSTQHKIDALNTILSCIGGITPVENLMLLGSTNRKDQIDEALLSRLPVKFFVGRPSPQARRAMITNSEEINLSDNMIDQLVHLTTNFSGRALTRCISDILTKTKKYKESNKVLTEKKLAAIAARSSRQFNIKLGNYSIPELFTLKKLRENPLSASFLRLVQDDDNQIVLNFKSKIVEILYRRCRAGPPDSIKKSQKIVELGHREFVVNDFIESLLLSTQQDKDSDTEFIVDYINILDNVASFKITDIHAYLSKKVAAVEARAEASSSKKCILVWLDLLEQASIKKQLKPDFIKSWFEANHERLRSTPQKNLYHIFITSTSNCPRLLDTIFWRGLAYEKKKEIPFTGRILIDLSEQNPDMRFEVRGKGNSNILYNEPLLFDESSATNSSQVIPSLAEFASERGIDFLLLFDHDFLSTNNAFDESKIKEYINEKMQEFHGYPKSLLIVDADSLVGMVKSVSESSMGISTSYNITDPRLYNTIIHYVRTLPKILDAEEYWVAIISKNKELSKMIKKDIGWPMSLKENEELKNEEKKQEITRCLRCRDAYIEAKNELNQCPYHPGFLFEFSAPSSEWTIIEEESKAKEIALKKMRRKSESHANTKNEVQFLYICCLNPLGSPCCEKYKHTCDFDLYMKSRMKAMQEYQKKFEELKERYRDEN